MLNNDKKYFFSKVLMVFEETSLKIKFRLKIGALEFHTGNQNLLCPYGKQMNKCHLIKKSFPIATFTLFSINQRKINQNYNIKIFML